MGNDWACGCRWSAFGNWMFCDDHECWIEDFLNKQNGIEKLDHLNNHLNESS